MACEVVYGVVIYEVVVCPPSIEGLEVAFNTSTSNIIVVRLDLIAVIISVISISCAITIVLSEVAGARFNYLAAFWPLVFLAIISYIVYR